MARDKENQRLRTQHETILLLAVCLVCTMLLPLPANAAAPEPVVAVHVSELTRALETMPAKGGTPTGSGTTGREWWSPAWHYFVMPESVKEALRSDGTPFVEVSDAAIASGKLLYPDGSPRYPIVISLASEAVGDDEIAPLRAYVAAGGILLAGSSAFTRYPDGSPRTDFALAAEMGLHLVNSPFQSWYVNQHFTKAADHRLVADIPGGILMWRMPLNSEEPPMGVAPGHYLTGAHYAWQTSPETATVLANGDGGPLLAVRQYGRGTFVYHAAMQPLMSHGAAQSGTYAYLIFRRAIEWAFDAVNLPLVRLSPWRFPYDSAFIVRHDFENYADMIRQIESSAAFESAAGARGDYYFCTGTLREEMSDAAAVKASLQRAVTRSGATIGSHNGGLKNPANASLKPADFDYWHWGPDEAVGTAGADYAQTSVLRSFQDIEAWLAGTDNGRPGCGAAGDCPRIWASPYFNSIREDSYAVLERLGTTTAGEQKLGPFPHWTLSTQSAGRQYAFLSVPAGDWYLGSEVAQKMEEHSSASMRAAVDFYYNLGGLVSLYGHSPSLAGTVQGDYAAYAASKPWMWATNAAGLFDWWRVRSGAAVSASYTREGGNGIALATVSGAADYGITVAVTIPWAGQTAGVQVLINGSPANPADYRVSGNIVKVRAGGPSSITVVYPVADTPPGVTSFTPANPSIGFDIAITGFLATDDLGVAAYCITTTATPPAANAACWSPAPPASFSVGGAGTYPLYPWVKDAAGAVSAVFGPVVVQVYKEGPAVAISRPSSSTGNSGLPVSYTITYTGAAAITLSAADVTLNATGTATGTVSVSGAGTGRRTVTVSGIGGMDGTLSITLAPYTAVDAEGNRSAGAGPGTAFRVDNNSGDSDGNGVDRQDAVKALRITAGLDKPTAADYARLDVAPLVGGERKPDGKIDLSDVTAILRKAENLSSW